MDWKAYVPKNWRAIAAYAAVAGAVLLLTWLGYLKPGDVPLPPPPDPIFQPSEAQAGGWVSDPEAVKAVQETIAFKVFADTPAGLSGDPLPEFVYLWKHYEKLFARPPPSKDQKNIGSCVSFGTNTAIERSLATQIVFAGGGRDEFKHLAEEVTYGGSRVEIGGGRIRGDGSVGAWAAQFTQKWGIVARDKYGPHDLSTYSVETCRKFGQSGIPDDLEKIARERPVKDITLVRDWPSAKKAIASGYGIAICSSQGFSFQRDENGICRPQGTWQHCMSLDGYAKINGKEYGHIVNSYGPNAHKGPTGPGSPPPCGFWADSATITRMLGQGDSWAFSGVVGFPKRDLDWFVRAAPRPNGTRLASLDLQFATIP